MHYIHVVTETEPCYNTDYYLLYTHYYYTQ